MSNDWFRFREFMVRQEKTAMKVGTDGVLLGAWSGLPPRGGNVLDVGTGTGLLALMIAQRADKVSIDAIDISQAACDQAGENVKQSKWSHKIRVICSDYQAFTEKASSLYDLIICNPPFFSRSLKPSGEDRDLARHDENLSLNELMYCSSLLLKDSGIFSLILPYERLDEFLERAAANDMKCTRQACVRPNLKKPFHRVMLEFSKTGVLCTKEEFNIEEGERHRYSGRYRELTAAFYL